MWLIGVWRAGRFAAFYPCSVGSDGLNSCLYMALIQYPYFWGAAQSPNLRLWVLSIPQIYGCTFVLLGGVFFLVMAPTLAMQKA